MSAQTHLAAAYQAMKAKEYEAAITAASAAVEADPDSHKGYQLIAAASRLLGQPKNALIAIEKALEIAPRDAESLSSYGHILLQQGRTFEAIAALKSSLEIAPNFPQPAIALGQLYLRGKNPVQAADVFQEALAHSPEHPMLLRGLLFSLKDAQQFTSANALLAKLPGAPDVALTAGQVALGLRQKPVAEANFLRALSHPPASSLAFRALAQMQYSDSQKTQAEGAQAAAQMVHKFIDDNPDAAPFYLFGAEILSELEQADAALALVTRAESKFGEVSNTQYLKAKIYNAAGEGEKGFEAASQALKSRPGDISILAELAQSALMSGRAERALQACTGMRRVQPRNQFWIAMQAAALRALGQEEDHQALQDYGFVQSHDLPPPPEYDSRDNFLAQLKTALEKRHAGESRTLGAVVQGGTQTSSDLRFADERVIQDFFQSLAKPIKDYIAQMPDDSAHPLHSRKRESYRLSGASSVNLAGEGFLKNHLQADSWLTGIFYVNVPDDIAARADKAGWAAFGKPPFNVAGPSGKALGAGHMIAPQAGSLVLFPSYNWHGTVPLAGGSENCLSLTFHVVPA